ncbi:Tn3 family transposase [Nonomuraea sp. NPDC049624]
MAITAGTLALRRSWRWSRFRTGTGPETRRRCRTAVLTCVMSWNTFSMDRAFDQLEAEGYSLAEEDVARPSPFVRQHINVLGRYALHPR